MNRKQHPMSDINPTISIITLNINGRNILIKRQKLWEWIKAQASTMCCPQEIQVKNKDTYRLKVKEWRKICHTNTNQKKARAALCLSGKESTCQCRTYVWSLVWEDPTCCGATKPVHHKLSLCPRTQEPQRMSRLNPPALEPVLCNKSGHHNEKPTHRN